MKICIPVMEDRGSDSPVSKHFGSAPLFMIVDSETGSRRAIANGSAQHAHGMCTPLSLLEGEAIDGMVVGGIGRGALAKLDAAGVRVYLAEQATVGQTVDAFKAGKLREVGPDMACGRHGHGHGHGHP